MRNRANTLVVLVLALMVPLSACDTGADPGFGSVSVLLTDAPGDVVEAWVTITDIYLQGQAGEGDPPQGRAYLLQDEAETHELLSLANATADLVIGQAVPTGVYGQLRVVMSGGCIKTEAGAVYASSPSYTECGDATGTLQMPSFAQTGVKVLLHGFTVTSGEHALLLDFHVGDTFGPGPAGASGKWVMNPVIHAAEISLTAGVTATLDAGDVELPDGFDLADFSATLTPAEGDASEVAFAEVGGVFRADFRFLIPANGPFEVELNAPDGLTVEVAPASPQSVSPGSGEIATIDWVLESAEEDEG